jgi:hypothetical protein
MQNVVDNCQVEQVKMWDELNELSVQFQLLEV